MDIKKVDSEVLDGWLEQMANLLKDDCYVARRQAAIMIPLLYSKWTEPQVQLSRSSHLNK